MKTTFTLALTLIATSLFAQSKPIDVAIQQVNDRRTNGSFSQLTINLDLPKIPSADVDASRVLISAATDDSGRSLLDPEASEPQLTPTMHAADKKTPPPPASVTVTLLNPDRKAKTVKEVRGEIELYMPGKDPNSIAEIAKFTSFAGKPLTHRALKANAIEIALLSPAQLDAERKKLVAIKRKELKDLGYTDGEELESSLKSQTESLLAVEEGEFIVRFKDPNHRIQDLSYISGTGELKSIGTRVDEGLVYLSTWGDKPQADWKLKVSMKTPKNTVRYTFALKDVPLP